MTSATGIRDLPRRSERGFPWERGRPRPPLPVFPVLARPRSRRRPRGFTLLEVLLSLALIALLASVLVGLSSRLTTDQPATASDVFWLAVREARKAALKSEHEIRLTFDKDKKQFLLLDGLAPATLATDGFTRIETPRKTIPVPAPVSAELAVDFLAPAPKGGGSAILVGGVLIEAQTIPYVSFYPDGTCRPFRAQFVRGGATSMLTVDPWTCAPVLTPRDPNAPPI